MGTVRDTARLGDMKEKPQIDEIVRQLIARKKYVFLCTNALLIPKKLHLFKPSRYFTWVVHLDGLRDRHDESVCKEGVFDEVVEVVGRSLPGGCNGGRRLVPGDRTLGTDNEFVEAPAQLPGEGCDRVQVGILR